MSGLVAPCRGWTVLPALGWVGVGGFSCLVLVVALAGVALGVAGWLDWYRYQGLATKAPRSGLRGIGRSGTWSRWFSVFMPAPGTCDESADQRAEGHRTIWRQVFFVDGVLGYVATAAFIVFLVPIVFCLLFQLLVFVRRSSFHASCFCYGYVST